MIPLKKRFFEFLYDIDFIGREKALWEELKNAYKEPHRAYHTLDHIQAMLSHFDEIKDELDNPDMVEAVIWYHDAIYKTLATHPDGLFDNEVESGDLLAKRLRYSKFDLQLDELHKMTTATKHGAVVEPDSDTAYLLDIDISILGSSLKTYQEYAKNIRKEYSFVPEEIYKKERVKILQSFLDMPTIYQTSYFQNKFEKQARLNLVNEIKQLTQKKQFQLTLK